MAESIRYATPARPRNDLLVQSGDEHVWVAMAVHRISGEKLRAAAGGQLDMDRENLATIEVGCYVCEQAYQERLSYRRCPGEPTAARGRS